MAPPVLFLRQVLEQGFEILQDLKDVNKNMGNLLLIDILASMTSIIVSCLFLSSFYTIFISNDQC